MRPSMREQLLAGSPQLTVVDVAHHLRLQPHTVTNMLNAGTLPGYRLPEDLWLIWADELADYLEHQHNTQKTRLKDRPPRTPARDPQAEPQTVIHQEGRLTRRQSREELA